MKQQLAGLVAVAVVVALAADAAAQGRGGFGGVQRGALLRLDSVQDELGLEDVQLDDIRAIQREMRGQRGERRNFRDMNEDERREAMEKRREEARDRQNRENDKLSEILDSDQMRRLHGIYAQVAGAAALRDPMIGNALGLSEDQQDQLQQIGADARNQMREAFQSGDREGMREKLSEINENTLNDSMAVLSDDQLSSLDALKGDPFELSEEDRRSMFSRRGGRGAGQGGEGGRRGRPQPEQ